MKKVIGLTGGAASGKTTVSKFFKKLGAEVINADLIGHVIQREQETIDEIVATFGEEVLSDTFIDRKKLGSIVFKDKKQLEKLNKIMHPRMYKRIASMINESSNDIIILDMAILFEAGFNDLCNEFIVIYSDTSLQMKRLLKRDHSKEIAEDILSMQLDIKEKIKLATYVIKNESTIFKLKKKVSNLFEYLKK
ncbi:dephospho-CoA kinase [Mycoplasmatota bacterium WC44]